MASELFVIRGSKSRIRGSVIFVHGLGGHPSETWGASPQGDRAAFWPDWLAVEKPLRDLAFYTLKLPMPWIGSPLSVRDIAKQVFDLLTTSSHANAILNVPIAFICHSLGGLVIKDLVILLQDLALDDGGADSPARRLFDQIAQVTFIATPHRGSKIATALSKVPILSSQLTQDLTEANSQLELINTRYQEICYSRNGSLTNSSFHEKAPYWGNYIVNEASSDPGLRGVVSIPIDADHVSICKPGDKGVQVYSSICGTLAKLHESRPKPTEWIASAKAKSTPIVVDPEDLVESSQSESWASVRNIAAILAIVAALAATGEGLRRWSQPATSAEAPTTAPLPPQPWSQNTPAPAPKKMAENDLQRAEAVKRLAEQVAVAEERRLSTVATKNAIAQASSLEQLDQLAALYPVLKPGIEARRTVLESEKQQQEKAEQEAAGELAASIDPARISEIGARWPTLKPQVEAKLASLRSADEKAGADSKKFTLDRITRIAQDGLRRAGCFTGPTTGTWGPLTRKAAEDFNRHASAQIAAEAPTAEAEAILKAVKARLCPLVCAAPKVAKDGACAVVTCEPGKMPASGSVCEPAYVAWIGSEATRDGAETIFAAAQLAHTDLLRHRQAEIKEAANGQRFSVRIGPAASKDAVRDLCAKLKSGGLAAKCYPAPL